jgi:hypothetical protein
MVGIIPSYTAGEIGYIQCEINGYDLKKTKNE